MPEVILEDYLNYANNIDGMRDLIAELRAQTLKSFRNDAGFVECIDQKKRVNVLQALSVADAIPVGSKLAPDALSFLKAHDCMNDLTWIMTYAERVQQKQLRKRMFYLINTVVALSKGKGKQESYDD